MLMLMLVHPMLNHPIVLENTFWRNKFRLRQIEHNLVATLRSVSDARQECQHNNNTGRDRRARIFPTDSQKPKPDVSRTPTSPSLSTSRPASRRLASNSCLIRCISWSAASIGSVPLTIPSSMNTSPTLAASSLRRPAPRPAAASEEPDGGGKLPFDTMDSWSCETEAVPVHRRELCRRGWKTRT